MVLAVHACVVDWANEGLNGLGVLLGRRYMVMVMRMAGFETRCGGGGWVVRLF